MPIKLSGLLELVTKPLNLSRRMVVPPEAAADVKLEAEEPMAETAGKFTSLMESLSGDKAAQAAINEANVRRFLVDTGQTEQPLDNYRQAMREAAEKQRQPELVAALQRLQQQHTASLVQSVQAQNYQAALQLLEANARERQEQGRQERARSQERRQWRDDLASRPGLGPQLRGEYCRLWLEEQNGYQWLIVSVYTSDGTRLTSWPLEPSRTCLIRLRDTLRGCRDVGMSPVEILAILVHAERHGCIDRHLRLDVAQQLRIPDPDRAMPLAELDVRPASSIWPLSQAVRNPMPSPFANYITGGGGGGGYSGSEIYGVTGGGGGGGGYTTATTLDSLTPAPAPPTSIEAPIQTPGRKIIIRQK